MSVYLWHIPDKGISVSTSGTVVISTSGSGVCVLVWGSWECVSVDGGWLGRLPWLDAAADAEDFALVGNPSLWCSWGLLPWKELTLSPLPRRGSRFWGSAEGTTSPFLETRRPLWASTECRKPSAARLEVLPLDLSSLVPAVVNTGDWIERGTVGTSLSEKKRKSKDESRQVSRQEMTKMTWRVRSGWLCLCPPLQHLDVGHIICLWKPQTSMCFCMYFGW